MIKKITEYTNAELLKLTDDAIETIIKLHLADAGVKFPIKPVVPTYFDIAEADVTSWQVNGIDLHFMKKEVAEEIAKILRENVSIIYEREWTSDYDHQTLKAVTSDYDYKEGIQVKLVKSYSRELLNEISTKVSKNKQLKEAYEVEVKAYEQAFEAAKEIMEEVRNVVRIAQDKQYEKDRLLQHFQEYLSLAEDNKEIAWKFMKKAYSVDQEQEDYINAQLDRK